MGKKARDGVQSWDHALSGTSALFANDTAPGELVEGQLERVAFPASTMQLPQTSEWKRRVGKEGACPADGCVLTMVHGGQSPHFVQIEASNTEKRYEEWHPPCSSQRSHRPRSFHIQVTAMCRCLKLDMVLGQTQGRAVSTAALFFGVAVFPPIATRVEKVSKWITM